MVSRTPARGMAVVKPYRGQGGHPAMPEVRLWEPWRGPRAASPCPDGPSSSFRRRAVDLPTREEVALFAVPHARLRFAWRHLAEDRIVQRNRAEEQAVGGSLRLGRCGDP